MTLVGPDTDNRRGTRAEPAIRPRMLHIVQGEHRVSDAPDVVLTTILGSCVAACMRDPEAGVGGMNHFLLPGDETGSGSEDSGFRYGVHLMELLVNGLLQRGGRRDRLEAKLFGGAKLMQGLTDVGSKNAEFAHQFLRREGIRALPGSLRGTSPRRIQFWPVSGRARQILLGRDEQLPFEQERRSTVPPASTGSVELF